MFVVMIFGEWLLLVWPNFDHFQSQDFSRFGLCDDFDVFYRIILNWNVFKVCSCFSFVFGTDH